MLCLDDSVDLVGDFKAFSASNFVYMFERCNQTGPIECKSDEEISEFLENKYLVIISNQTSFNYTGHMGNEGKFYDEIWTAWIRVSPTVNDEHVFHLQEYEYTMYDSIFWSFIKSKRVVYKFKEQGMKIFNKYNLGHDSSNTDLMVTFEFSDQIFHYKRHVYNYLALVASTGGLFSSLVLGFSYLTGYVFAFSQYESYLASKLFQPSSVSPNNKGKKPLDYKSVVSVKQMCLVYCPKWTRKLCCKPSQNDLNFLTARKHLWKELNAVNFLREMRFLRAIGNRIKKNPQLLEGDQKNKQSGPDSKIKFKRKQTFERQNSSLFFSDPGSDSDSSHESPIEDLNQNSNLDQLGNPQTSQKPFVGLTL